jgi:hypothetical protein
VIQKLNLNYCCIWPYICAKKLEDVPYCIQSRDTLKWLRSNLAWTCKNCINLNELGEVRGMECDETGTGCTLKL